MVELREPLEQLIRSPWQFTKGTTFPRANEIRLYDTTLRDGEQTPGVAFSPEQKLELAGLLSDAGVDINQKLVHTLLRLIKDIREGRADRADHADEIRTYYHNLNNLGLTEDDLVSYALVLGPELQ